MIVCFITFTLLYYPIVLDIQYQDWYCIAEWNSAGLVKLKLLVNIKR